MEQLCRAVPEQRLIKANIARAILDFPRTARSHPALTLSSASLGRVLGIPLRSFVAWRMPTDAGIYVYVILLSKLKALNTIRRLASGMEVLTRLKQ